MTISAWALGRRQLWRDLRAGELRLLMVAVTLAVAALCAVGFFSDRLQGGLQRDAAQLLGGDVVLVSDHEPAARWTQQAQADGLAHTLTLSFPTMGRAPDAQGGTTRLVTLKAVSPGYPLSGQLRLARDAQDRSGTPTRALPAAGEVWVDPSLLEALGLQRGGTLLLGERAFRITELIALEPDRGTGFMSFAPRVMMNAADLPATGLVQPASRISWRLALAGPDAAVQRYRRWAEAALNAPGGAGLRLETLDSGRPEMRSTLARAEKFLNLVALLAALLSAVAVALAARGFASRHLDGAAMLRVLGLPQRRMAQAYAVEFLSVGLAASAAGVLLGWALHHAFVTLLAGLVDAALPPPSAWPALLGLGIGMTLLVAFGLPPVLQLAQVPPLRVMRRDVGALKATSLAVLALGVAGFAALLLAVSADVLLGLIAVGGFGLAVLLFALLSWGAVHVLRRAVNEQTAPRWLVLATRQLAARPVYAVVQVSSLAVGLLALVLLVLLRTDLIASWRAATPADAPNRFVINVMPDQAEAFRATLHTAGVSRMDFYPMFRGRLVAINGRDVAPGDYTDERARRLVEREFNLSHAAHKPAHNDISAGRWVANEADAISVEQGLAETLGLKLGDTLRFDVAGTPVEARITSLRKVDWASMHVNFFAMFPLAEMPDVPTTYIAAFRVPEMWPPRSPAARGALPPEGDAAALGRPDGGAQPPRSAAAGGSLWSERAAAALGRPGDGARPPRSPAARGALPPEGAAAALGRPGDGAQPPRSAAAGGSLPPEAVAANLERPGVGNAGFDNALVREFPNITNVDMEQTIAQVQRVLDQVVRAVEFLFGFTLMAGLIVLFAAVSATREERAREFAIMRAVGASAALLAQVQRAELVGVGLLAGVLASSVAVVVGWAMARYAFDFSWSASPWVPLAGASAGAVLALAAGWWSLREVLRRPVVETLRQAAE